MRELTIGKNDAGQRLDRFVAKSLPLLPPTLLQKYIRLKRIKVNGRGAKRDTRLESGDILQLYINDEFFDKPSEENMFLTLFQPRKKSGIPNGRTPLRPPCATGSTGTPAALSLPPRTRRPCGS